MGQYKVTKIVSNTKNVNIVQLKYTEGNEIKFLPGQYVDISFINDTQHVSKSFSISSSPFDKKVLEIVVPNLGDFRHKIYNVPIGTTLNVKGPYGKFVYSQDENSLPVFIAGGSGIAPIMSMLRSIDKKHKHTKFVLFYTCKTENDIIFFKEISKIRKHNKNFSCVFFITRHTKNDKFENIADRFALESAKRNDSFNLHDRLEHEGIKWEFSHIDEYMIVNKLKAVTSKIYYICGPYEMAVMLSYILQKLGVNSPNIKSELW